MRAAIAVLLAGLLVWMQAGADVSPIVHVEPAQCCGCDCGGSDCCGTPAPSNPQPSPTAAVRLVAPAQAKLPKPAKVESRTVFSSPVRKYSLPPVAQRAPALPLFRQHCALLI